MADGLPERLASTPRWALEKAEAEMARFSGEIPDCSRVDVWLRNPSGWTAYFAFAAYIARMETMPSADIATIR
jgi:hypothetical protein